MHFNSTDKENIDPEGGVEMRRQRRYKILKDMVNRNTKTSQRVTKIPPMTLSGKIAEEIQFEDETVNKFTL
ncbi:hypothetical protein NUSPORA_02274 [Nucleospora cyclopteri]